ncbi:hypothetical protein I552_9114 [Mycobacterium xenopi 3993]|nr:hypothetical protein I552_9114 [Mycobacterium xenopi 3993]
MISTAFRPIDAEELARNPFRVFTSMLATRDRRFFDAGLRRRVEAFLARRQLFDPALIARARAVAADGVATPTRPTSSSVGLLRRSRCRASRSTVPGMTSSPRCPRWLPISRASPPPTSTT